MKASPTALPMTMDGMTVLRLLTANGIAPSVMPMSPMKMADMPIWRSACSHFFFERNVERPMPSGGMATAMRYAPFGS